jgi:hypothetical protein
MESKKLSHVGVIRDYRSEEKLSIRKFWLRYFKLLSEVAFISFVKIFDFRSSGDLHNCHPAVASVSLTIL